MIAELGQQKAHPDSAGVGNISRAVEHAHCAQDPGIRPLTAFSAKPDLMVQLEGEQLNSLIHALEEWERHLAQLDSESLRCVDVKLIP